MPPKTHQVHQMINKVLVANRGEIAVRVLRTCKELGLETVAIYSETDREAPHVRYADEAYCIGPPPVHESYVRGERIVQVALEASAQAIHPGYGLLAESPDFARACSEAGLIFVGPRPETGQLLADRVALRRLARRLHVPVLPGSDRPLDHAGLLAAAERIGYPVLLRVATGEGEVELGAACSRPELEAILSWPRREARAPLGDGQFHLERMLEHARRVEVQLLADGRGRVIHLGDRECSVQRRHQRLIEEAPSRALPPALRRRICRAAVRVGRAARCVGAATVEFLHTAGGEFYLQRVSPLLQVGHTVTEAITGVDIVKEQLRIAAGRELRHAQKDIRPRGAALECRILAEDPCEDFAPCAGRVNRLREPGGPGVRVDSGICEGLAIVPYYDPLLAKLVVWGETRGVAIVRMRRALEEYQIHGVTTNLDLHRALLDSHRFFGGHLHGRFLEERFVPPEPQDEECLAAALTAVLLDWHGRAGAQAGGEGDASLWKALGRWELQGRGGW